MAYHTDYFVIAQHLDRPSAEIVARRWLAIKSDRVDIWVVLLRQHGYNVIIDWGSHKSWRGSRYHRQTIPAQRFLDSPPSFPAQAQLAGTVPSEMVEIYPVPNLTQ